PVKVVCPPVVSALDLEREASSVGRRQPVPAVTADVVEAVDSLFPPDQEDALLADLTNHVVTDAAYLLDPAYAEPAAIPDRPELTVVDLRSGVVMGRQGLLDLDGFVTRRFFHDVDLLAASQRCDRRIQDPTRLRDRDRGARRPGRPSGSSPRRPRISPAAADLISRCPFPGNVR